MIKTKHVFQLSRIIDKMDIKNEIQTMISESKKKKVDTEALGTNIVMALLTKIHLAESETMTLLAEVSGKSKKEMEDQAPKETFKMIKDMLSEEGVLDFLKDTQTD